MDLRGQERNWWRANLPGKLRTSEGDFTLVGFFNDAVEEVGEKEPENLFVSILTLQEFSKSTFAVGAIPE